MLTLVSLPLIVSFGKEMLLHAGKGEGAEGRRCGLTLMIPAGLES